MFNYVAYGNLKLSGRQYLYNGGGSIGLKLRGCAAYRAPKSFIYLKWKEGDEAWLYYEAVRGRLRSVFIKRVKVTVNEATFNQPEVIYFDLNNAAFNPEDLISNEEAINLATLYYQYRLEQAQKAVNLLACQ